MSAFGCVFRNCWSLARPLHRPWRCLTFPLAFSSKTFVQTPLPASESDLSNLLFTCGRQGNLRLGSCLHAYIIKRPPSFDLTDPPGLRSANVIYNSLLHVYCKCGEIHDAINLFDEMPLRDTVSWNSLISGCLKLGHLQFGFGYFKSLMRSGIYKYDQASLTSVLSACDGLEWRDIVRMIHALAILDGFETEITVGNALTTSYFRCQCSKSGLQVFNEMVQRNVVTWTAAISGLAQNEFYAESMNLFVEMHQCSSVLPNCLTYLSVLLACSGLRALKEGAQIHCVAWKIGIQSDVCIESALMHLYAKCGCVDDAVGIFEYAEVFDEVSLTVILAGFAQNGFDEEAIKMFVKIVKAGIHIHPSMISAILGVFGFDTSQGLGLQVHSSVIKKGFASNVYVSNGLINMYSKRGQLEESIKIFDGMPQMNQISWNSVIAAFARHGDGLKALQFYEEMQSKGVEPTDVTFLSLLHACSHIGLVHKGIEFLESMQMHGMEPRMEHYACIVDMYGRAGMLKEAKEFIEGLPVKADVLVWQALLGACSIYADINIGKYAAERLAQAAPGSPVPYVSMANMYSCRGRWRERATTIKRMKDQGIVKETGISWIEVDKKIHSFSVADEMHPQVEDVHEILWKLFDHMIDEEECVSSVGLRK